MKMLKRFLRVLFVASKRYNSDQHNQRAVLLTYYTLFAVVPLAALFFGIAKGFSLDDHLRRILQEKLTSQQEQFAYILSFAEKTLDQASGGLVAGVGVLVLLWTVIGLITAIETSFNTVWSIPPRRNWWRKFSDYLALMFFTPLLLVAVGTAGVVMRRELTAFAENMPVLNTISITLMELAANIVPMLLVCALFLLIYRFVPNTKVRWRHALFGSIIAGIAFQLLQDGFILLQKSVFQYNRIYGGFAALPLFLIWLNWSWHIIIFGAELCFVSQNIDNGMIGLTKKQLIPQKMRREHQLAILNMVFNHFTEYRGALSETEIPPRLDLPQLLFGNELHELVECGLLYRTSDNDGNNMLLPGVSPETFTVLDFYRRIDGSGSTTGKFAAIDKYLDNLNSLIGASGKNCLVKDL